MRVALFSQNPNIRDIFGDVVLDGVGRNSVNGVATGYEMDGPDFETRWRRDFPHPSRPVLGPTQLPV